MFVSLAALAATMVLDATEPSLTQVIAARDALLFDVMFAGCDPAALAALVTDDMEFYHDKGGAMDRT